MLSDIYNKTEGRKSIQLSRNRLIISPNIAFCYFVKSTSKTLHICSRTARCSRLYWEQSCYSWVSIRFAIGLQCKIVASHWFVGTEFPDRVLGHYGSPIRHVLRLDHTCFQARQSGPLGIVSTENDTCRS